MQSSRWVFFLYVLVSFLHPISRIHAQSSSSSSAPPSCPPSDRNALLSFKSKIIEDTTGILSSWTGADCCGGDWEGVQCNPTTGRVTSLTLQSPSSSSPSPLGPGLDDIHRDIYMKGTLSPALGDLTFLEALVVTGMKYITGPIPESLSNLRRLSQLVLEGNALVGSIPAGLGGLHLLQALVLDGNRLEGTIPSTLGNLNGLVQLNLGGNHLAGSIPPSFKSMNNLQFLGLSRNSLSGFIPDFIGHFRNLTFLDLSFNHFSGSIPVSLCTLPALSDLSLAGNGITGRIPDQINGLKSLTSLSLSENRLAGPVPESLAALPNLWYLNLSRNELSNPLPSVSLGKGRGILLPSLLSIDLSYNNLSLKTVPDWIRTRDLSAVHLAGCNLVGPLPLFTKPGSLTSLDLSNNRLTAALPGFLARMPNLATVRLSGNLLRFDVSKLALPGGISSLDLSRNQLFGPLSTLLGNATSRFLETLDVSRNSITGALPEFRQEGSNLKVLNVGSNMISGSIPVSISNLKELQRLDISRNRISGTIPPSLGELVKLQWLDLSINGLVGKIPDSLLRILHLRHANFRANRLCGEVPQGRPFNIFPPAGTVMAESSKDELLQLIKRFGAYITVKMSNFVFAFKNMDSRSVGAIAGLAVAIVFTWRLLRSPSTLQRRPPKRQGNRASTSGVNSQSNPAQVFSEVSTSSEDSKAQNVVDGLFHPVKLTLGHIVRQRLCEGRKVTCRLAGVILEESSPEELQKQVTVRSSALEVLLEISKYCDLYLMERVVDDESEKRVLDALEGAGIFTSGSLSKDKVLFCSTENGRTSFVRQLEPDWHIDTNPDIISQLARFIRYQLHVSPILPERSTSNVFSARSLEEFFGCM